MGLGHSDWSFEANIHGIGVGGVDGEIHLPVRVGEEHAVSAVPVAGHGF